MISENDWRCLGLATNSNAGRWPGWAQVYSRRKSRSSTDVEISPSFVQGIWQAVLEGRPPMCHNRQIKQDLDLGGAHETEPHYLRRHRGRGFHRGRQPGPGRRGVRRSAGRLEECQDGLRRHRRRPGRRHGGDPEGPGRLAAAQGLVRALLPGRQVPHHRHDQDRAQGAHRLHGGHDRWRRSRHDRPPLGRQATRHDAEVRCLVLEDQPSDAGRRRQGRRGAGLRRCLLDLQRDVRHGFSGRWRRHVDGHRR